MKKKTQVVMLPTNEKATVGSIVTRPSDNRMAIVNALTKDDTQPCIHQHLYFLSDEEIKEGDWVCNIEREPSIIQCIGKGSLRGWKKIIATTDSSLKIITGIVGSGTGIQLPQSSQNFIKVFVEEYNKGNVIKWVDVEYYDDIYFRDELQAKGKLKINSKNEISITIKESWSREEVIDLLHKRMKYTLGLDYDQTTTDKWIAENL